MRVASLLAKEPEVEQSFVPTSRMLDGLKKYTPRCVANSTRGYGGPKSENYGELPVISQRIWNNTLMDVPDWRVEAEQWFASTHLSRDRTFDCSGWQSCR